MTSDDPSLDLRTPSLRNWGELPDSVKRELPEEVVIDSGWGRLIFGHTFHDAQHLADTLSRERTGERDIALYIRDPHVLLSLAPHHLFLDPSHTYRLYFSDYQPTGPKVQPFEVEPVESEADVEAMHRIYLQRRMVPTRVGFVFDHREDPRFRYLVARSRTNREVLGSVIGIDHVEAFQDPENGSSLWCLAVDPNCSIPGLGEALVRRLVEDFIGVGRRYLDLSVLHDNRPAIGLYERLGFRRVPVFCVKNKNAINEPLYAAQDVEENLNPYARIITDEARRRGIGVHVIDAEMNYFRLTHGGRSILCRESLSELTSAVAMSACADKRVTGRILKRENLEVPEQQMAGTDPENASFLHRHGRVVVKPVDGEQGRDVFVDIATEAELERAIRTASASGPVMLESFIEGSDLRLVVIGDQVVASALRLPPRVTGTGSHTIQHLIERLSRRRKAQTDGESSIPIDDETIRVVRTMGYELDDVLPTGVELPVRRTANLHTGGTIEDVSDRVHPRLCEAALRAARALHLPVAGVDMIVPDITKDEYCIIEVNERPGLANHEPRPTAERFIDLLFPQTAHPKGHPPHETTKN
ncbi:MAG: N-acetylglutaminylglutamine synthetase [Myxococcota bacterium]